MRPKGTKQQLEIRHYVEMTPLQAGLGLHKVACQVQASPGSERLGLYFSLVARNLTGDDCFAFVQQLRRHLKRPLLVIWDRFSGPRKATRLLRDLYGRRIHVGFIQNAYSPMLLS